MDQFILLKLSAQEIKSLISDTIKEELKKIQIPSEPKKEVDLLTRKEAAAFLGVSLPTLYKLIKQQLIKPKILGTLIRFDKNELSDCLNGKFSKNGRAYVR